MKLNISPATPARLARTVAAMVGVMFEAGLDQNLDAITIVFGALVGAYDRSLVSMHVAAPGDGLMAVMAVAQRVQDGALLADLIEVPAAP